MKKLRKTFLFLLLLLAIGLAFISSKDIKPSEQIVVKEIELENVNN